MDLEANLCYEALRSRDPRFDGRFFTAVLTTGIYCRPICPARTPKRTSVRFYPCAAAAEEAGFRPCRRCRPESAPGTPGWIGTSATVVRGMRLIAGGVLDNGKVEDLGSRLGVGERQLRRLFVRHLGASPLALAMTRRVHFARELIDSTSLPMTEVAFSSGFSSIRQFNHAVKSVFGRTPTELREGAHRRPARKPESGPHRERLELRLPYRAPYDWASMAAFLSLRAIPGVEAAGPGFYRRSIPVDGVPGLIEVRPEATASRLLLAVQAPAGKGLIGIVERARRLFDIESDPYAIRDCLKRDPLLSSSLSKRPGLRVPGAWDGFELAVRAILGQQITVTAAATLAGRMAERFGARAEFAAQGITRLFPGPEVLAEADSARIGLPGARAQAIRSLARAVAEGKIVLDPSAEPESTRSRLREIPGIGEWTAQYITMRALRDPDAFPAGDLGIQRALEMRKERDVLERAESWRPWRAYAVMHLWIHDTGRKT